MDPIISPSFMLEDITDPVAVAIFENTPSSELANDPAITGNILDGYDDEVENIFNSEDDNFYEDYCIGCATDTLNGELDTEAEVDMDLSDEDGEIIDIVDGLI